MKYAGVLLAAMLIPTPGLAMDITSSSIRDGVISRVSACEDQDGNDASPQITISDAPAGTTYFAIIMDDPDARALDGKTWVHWNVVNIPVENTTLEEDSTPPGVALANDNEDRSYGGMCPEDGRHMYRIGAFALSAPVDTDGASALTIETFKSRYADQIIGEALVRAAFP